VHEVETGLVALEGGLLRSGGEVAEGGGEAIELVAGGAGVDIEIHHVGLDGHGAAETPAGGDHFFDEAELGVVLGGEALDVAIEERFEGVGTFIAEQDALGEQAVAQGVPGGARLALRSDGTAGARTIGAGSENTFFR